MDTPRIDTTDLDNALGLIALYSSTLRMVLAQGEEGDADAIPVSRHIVGLIDTQVETASRAVVPLHHTKPSSPERKAP